MIRCGVYLRQSDDPNDDELAVGRQWNDIVGKICEPRGWVPERYCDNDRTAVGKKRVLPDRDRMLKDIERGYLQAIGVWDCDRLYREPSDLEHIIDVANAHGTILATVTGDIDLGTDNGRLFARIKGAVAKAETERRSARQKAKGRQMAEAGEAWTSKRPFGYELDGALVAHEADALAQVFHMILEGHSKLAPFLRMWNEAGIVTSLGNPWTSQVQLRKLLLNPRYAGLRAYSGEIVGEAKWPKIIEPDEWYAVRDILTDPARNTGRGAGRVYLLSGIARCGECAAAGVHATMGTAKQVRTGLPKYRCRTCFHVGRSVKKADDHVTDLVVERLAQPDAAELLVDDRRPDLEKLRREAAAMRTKLAKLAADWAEDVLTDEQLAVATKKAKARLRAAETAMEDAHKARLFKGLVGEDAYKFPDALLERRRAAIDALMTITFNRSVARGVFDPSSIQIDWAPSQ